MRFLLVNIYRDVGRSDRVCRRLGESIYRPCDTCRRVYRRARGVDLYCRLCNRFDRENESESGIVCLGRESESAGEI